MGVPGQLPIMLAMGKYISSANQNGESSEQTKMAQSAAIKSFQDAAAAGVPGVSVSGTPPQPAGAPAAQGAPAQAKYAAYYSNRGA